MLLSSLLVVQLAYLPLSCRMMPASYPVARHCRSSVALEASTEDVATQEFDLTLMPVPASIAAPAERDPEEVTLELLEWDRLSTMVAAQANTRRAREELEGGLPLGGTREESEVLQKEMEEAFTLEQNLARSIDLRGFIDVAPLVTHASKGGLLDGESLVGIADSLQAAATLVRTLRDGGRDDGSDDDAAAAAGVTLLPSYFDGLPVQAELRLAIVQALDESGSVRDSADPALGELRYARKEVATAARRELGRLIQLKEGALAAKSASMRDDRYVLQVIAKQKHMVPGTVRDVSASGSTLFIEPKQIEPVNTKLRQLAKREKSIERVVLKKLSALVGGAKASVELIALQEAVTRVDCAAARARYSARLDGQPVVFSDAAEATGVRLTQLRHPLLVWRSASEAPDNDQMVAMDVLIPPKVHARSLLSLGVHPAKGGCPLFTIPW